jgi:predicted transcriptional regulator
MNISVLSQIDITPNEGLVLEQLYSYGVLTALDVAQKLHITKNSALFLLKSLENKRYVEKRTRNNIFLFQARDPNTLLDAYKAKVTELSEKEDEFTQVIGAFKSIQNYDTLKKCHYYDDAGSIKRLHASLLDGVQTGRIERSYTEKNDLEIYRTKDYVFLLSLKENFALRIQPAADYDKIVQLFKLLLLS